jgi:hypothetical protein
MPKWLFWLALFFVVFLIYTQPDQAGVVAGGFAEFAVNLLGAVGEFLTGLFEGASAADGAGGGGGLGSHTHGDTSGADGGVTTTTLSSCFTHTHDGVTHSHGC